MQQDKVLLRLTVQSIVHLCNLKKLSGNMKGSNLATSERQAFNHLTPHITLAPVMSPEEGCTLHSETLKGNQSSPRVFIRTYSAVNFTED